MTHQFVFYFIKSIDLSSWKTINLLRFKSAYVAKPFKLWLRSVTNVVLTLARIFNRKLHKCGPEHQRSLSSLV
jgi:hypothetical protein